MRPPLISAETLIDRYDLILLDAYGPLVTAGGATPGAASFMTTLTASGVGWMVVTNDASRLPETSAASYRARGIDIAADRIVSSGTLIAPYFAEHGLRDCRCIVLGTADSKAFVGDAGGVIVDASMDCDVVVVGDEAGYDLLTALDDVTSTLIRQVAAGDAPRLVCPNPDRVYPKAGGEFGVASGAIAALLESALDAVFPNHRLRFERLGKPNAPIFEEATRRAETFERAVMVGDQLTTDIAGANAFGIDSVLFRTPLVTDDALRESAVQPTFLMERW